MPAAEQMLSQFSKQRGKWAPETQAFHPQPHLRGSNNQMENRKRGAPEEGRFPSEPVVTSLQSCVCTLL